MTTIKERDEIESLAQDYFCEVMLAKDEGRDAFDRLIEMAEKNPESTLMLVKRLVEMSSTEIELAHVGAGPIEELLVRHSSAYMDRVIDEARQNERLSLALKYTVIGRGDIPEYLLEHLERFQRS